MFGLLFILTLKEACLFFYDVVESFFNYFSDLFSSTSNCNRLIYRTFLFCYVPFIHKLIKKVYPFDESWSCVKMHRVDVLLYTDEFSIYETNFKNLILPVICVLLSIMYESYFLVRLGLFFGCTFYSLASYSGYVRINWFIFISIIWH